MAEQAIPGWKRWLEGSGDQVTFLGGFFRNVFRGGFEWSEFVRQCYEIGYKSFMLVGTTAFIMGLVLALQLRPTLIAFGAFSMLPKTLAVSIVREIGPVITAIICAGKIGSGIGAELGSMKVTEQIDAMDVSGANPIQYLVVTRILATTFMVPILTLLGDLLGLFGGFLAINITSHVSALLYFNKCVASIDFTDLLPAFIKTIFFGFIIGFVGCYKGYNSNRGTESVGLAANSAVVTASLWIFVVDAIVVQISSILFIINMEEPEKQAKLKTKPSADEIVIHIKGLKKSFGSKDVLKNINLDVKCGENLVILGKSGTGKSVTIQCIVGMLTPDGGELTVFGEEVADLKEKQLKELRMRIGFLFQGGALYDSMTVRENLEFPLTRVLKIKDQGEIDQRVEEVLDGVGLLDSIDKMPSDLSGGMRKRAGLARTLIIKPEIMLYDEPTTGLDPITSREISELILQMQKKYKTTSIIITHDMECANITADRIVVMKDGEYVAEGSFEELKKSKEQFVRSFFN